MEYFYIYFITQRILHRISARSWPWYFLFTTNDALFTKSWSVIIHAVGLEAAGIHPSYRWIINTRDSIVTSVKRKHGYSLWTISYHPSALNIY